MVVRLEAVDKEADGLFAKMRSQSRKFYEALSRYENAEKAARAHLLSRDTYEEARRKTAEAKVAADGLRTERDTLRTLIHCFDRVLRVGPFLRQRDQLVVESEAFVGTVGHPEEFSTKVRDATKAHEDAEKARQDAVSRSDELKGKIDGLVVSQNLAAAEQVVILLNNEAVKVSGARGSRPNRSRDLDLEEAKLHPLREMLGRPPDADVAAMMPERAAIDRVQSLAAEALKRDSALGTAEERVSELADALGQIETRIAEGKAAGYDRPLGVTSAQFGSLVAQRASLDARRRNAEVEKRAIQSDVIGLGVGSVEDLIALSCPAGEDVRAEQTARDEIRKDLAEQERLKRKADGEVAARLEEVAVLEAAGPVATVAAVADAREVRNGLWRPIRDAFVDGRVEGSAEIRRSTAEAFEERVGEADGMSDRRANEAGRVASKIGLERDICGARREASQAEQEIVELKKRLAVREEGFAAAYPEVSKRFPALQALVEFSTRRKDLVDRVTKAHAEATEIGVKTNELEPVVERMERLEAKLGLAATGAFDERVEALQDSITAHDARRADLARDIASKDENAAKLKTAVTKRDELRAWKATWDRNWPDAMRALGTSATASPTEGNKLATEWATARGILSTIAEIKKRLARMDEDEKRLREDVARTAQALGIEVAEDGVAGAQMLKTRWDENERLRVKREGLTEEYETAKVEAEAAEGMLKKADEELIALAAAIEVERDGLSTAAARFDARRAIEGNIADAERSASNAGDQLPIASLETEWGQRDLDAVRLDLANARARLKVLDGELDQAVLKEQEGRVTLKAFVDEAEVNRAIVERESATAEMHAAIERYLELSLASDLLGEAMAEVRAEQQDPLIARAGVLFASMTESEFVGIEADVDDKGAPVVKGTRANGETEFVAKMSDGTRDQLFLAFRLASLESYGESAEPLPFIADDILVHFDDDRARATLDLLAGFGERNQVLLFTHHKSVRAAASRLAEEGRANIVDLAKAA